MPTGTILGMGHVSHNRFSQLPGSADLELITQSPETFWPRNSPLGRLQSGMAPNRRPRAILPPRPTADNQRP